MSIIGLIVAVLVLVQSCSSNIISCGGFIKSQWSVDFSKIKVKLFTPEGSLRYETDCAPNNGYYMIPLYTKGQFVIKIQPPDGWSFEPAQVTVNVDGNTDLCSKGEDINFNFNGFALSGKVVSRGKDDGPADFGLVLSSLDSDHQLNAKTGLGGSYYFDKLKPGKYEITSSDKSICLGTKSASVAIVNDRVQVEESLEVAGYSLSGKIETGGKALPSAEVYLFSDQNVEISGCGGGKDQFDRKVVERYQKLHANCMAKCANDGSFAFPCVPSGDYVVIPIVRNTDVYFDIAPPKVDISILHGPVVLKKSFRVGGFTVSGRVVWKSGSENGVSNAQVYLNGKVVAKSDDTGAYKIKAVEAGNHKIEAKHENLQFEPLNVEISPQKITLPDIAVSKIELCGVVKIHKFPDGVPKLLQRKLLITNNDTKSVESLTTSDDGKFCKFVQRGDYKIEPQVLPQETEAGLKFFDPVIDITIDSNFTEPVLFEQFRTVVSGWIQCLGLCETVSIKIFKTADDSLVSEHITSDKDFDGQFEFVEPILPGEYYATLDAGRACWEQDRKPMHIGSEKLVQFSFWQVGIQIKIKTSHHGHFFYFNTKIRSFKGKIPVKPGMNSICISTSGRFESYIESCHKMKPEKKFFEIQDTTMIEFKAYAHKVSGRLLMPEKNDNLFVEIRHASTGLLETLGPLTTSTRSANKTLQWTYPFELHVNSNSDITVTPVSDSFLFSPETLDLKVENECLLNKAIFNSVKGIFIEGSVNPPLSAVSVKALTHDDSEVIFETSTGEDGKYSLGPFRSLERVYLVAEKDGYVLTELTTGQTEVAGGHFSAQKLAELNIEALNLVGEPIESVLISLSGASQFRSNNMTGVDGSLKFVGLNPGEYFIKPIFKEFQFDPPSQVVSIDEGSVVNVQLVGSRVAFSCRGLVRTLNGQPVVGIMVEAISEQCDNLQEESVTNSDGKYVIRGLKPDCQYSVRVKSTIDSSVPVRETAPAQYSVAVIDSDVIDKDLIVLPVFDKMHISGRVDCDPKFISSLKVYLYKANDLDSPIHIITMSDSLFFHLPAVSLDREEYIIRVVSNLNNKMYDDTEIEQIKLMANETFHHVVFRFKPKPKSMEAELSRSSYMILPIFIVCGLLFYNKKTVLPVMQDVLYQGFDTAKIHINNWQSKRREGVNNEPLHIPAELLETNQPSNYSETPPAFYRRKAKARKT